MMATSIIKEALRLEFGPIIQNHTARILLEKNLR